MGSEKTRTNSPALSDREQGLPPLPSPRAREDLALYMHFVVLFESIERRVAHYDKQGILKISRERSAGTAYDQQFLISHGEKPVFKIEIHEICPEEDKKSGEGRNKSYRSAKQFALYVAEDGIRLEKEPQGMATFDGLRLSTDQRKGLHRKVSRALEKLGLTWVNVMEEEKPPLLTVAPPNIPEGWWNDTKLDTMKPC